MSDSRKIRVQQFYDDFAPSYHADRYGTEEQRAINAVAQEMVLRLLWDRDLGSSTVLDCGCGTGRFSQLFSERGAVVTGIDASPKMLELAAQRAPKASFQVADVTNLPFENQFDIVICSQVLTHLHEYEGPLRSMRRALKPGGVVIVDFRNRLAPRNALYALRTGLQKLAGRPPDYDPHFATLGTLLKAAGRAGLRLADWKACGKPTDVSNSSLRAFSPTLVLRLTA